MSVETADILSETAEVLSAQPGKAVVLIPRSKECEGCHACSMMDPEHGMVAEVEDQLGVSPGDRVRIETRGVEGKIKAALLLFGLPMAMLLAGAIGSQPLLRRLHLGSAAEGLGVLCGLVLMAAGFALVYFVRKRAGKQAVRSRIVEILGPAQTLDTPS
jgi:positive regulator of sigma E activity